MHGYLLYDAILVLKNLLTSFTAQNRISMMLRIEKPQKRLSVPPMLDTVPANVTVAVRTTWSMFLCGKRIDIFLSVLRWGFLKDRCL